MEPIVVFAESIVIIVGVQHHRKYNVIDDVEFHSAASMRELRLWQNI